MSNQRNDADSIVSQALNSIPNSNSSSNVFNFHFNTYTNCYNSSLNSDTNHTEPLGDSGTESDTTTSNEEITAEIEIRENNNISSQTINTLPRRGVQTTTRSAIVPISMNSSTEDITNRLQEVVNTIINDTDTPDLQPISAGISMTPIISGGVINSDQQSNQRLTLQDINNNTEVFINNDLEQKCHICNELYKENDICRKNVKCGHYFHQSCIDTWYSENNKCPICNQFII
tara:strand:+ start:46 stop:738 length:693 start_codon:yes stop_codon:yes gene_type:complete